MKPLWVRGACLLAAVAVCACAAVVAVDDKTTTAADEKAIEQTIEKLAAALNARDAKAAAALFTPTAEFVDGDGNTFHGREAIEAEFAALFEANPHGQVKFATEAVRHLNPGVYVEEGVVTVASAKNPNMPGKQIGYFMLHTQQKDGTWLLASVRSHGEDDDTPEEALQELAWLIGDWVDESSDSIVKTHVYWSDNKNFILSDFVIQVAGKPVLQGTHRIGWDAMTKQFKSWVFDSQGGHAEGYWTQTEEAWVVKLSGVNSDGEAVSLTNSYRPVGPDSYAFTSTDRFSGSELQPDFSVLVVRKAPEPIKQTKK